MNRRDFLAALEREQVDVFVVDFDDLQREARTWLSFLWRVGNSASMVSCHPEKLWIHLTG
nr:hypothetical protein [Chroococcidiopsis cubana]